MAPSCNRSRNHRTDGLARLQFSSTIHAGAVGPSSRCTPSKCMAVSMLGAMGFSDSTCLPARSAASMAADITGIGSTSSTASISGSANICSIFACRLTSRPILLSALAMLLRVLEHTATIEQPGRLSRAGTCARSANQEQPTSPTRTGGLLLDGAIARRVRAFTVKSWSCHEVA